MKCSREYSCWRKSSIVILPRKNGWFSIVAPNPEMAKWFAVEELSRDFPEEPPAISYTRHLASIVRKAVLAQLDGGKVVSYDLSVILNSYVCWDSEFLFKIIDKAKDKNTRYSESLPYIAFQHNVEDDVYIAAIEAANHSVLDVLANNIANSVWDYSHTVLKYCYVKLTAGRGRRPLPEAAHINIRRYLMCQGVTKEEIEMLEENSLLYGVASR